MGYALTSMLSTRCGRYAVTHKSTHAASSTLSASLAMLWGMLRAIWGPARTMPNNSHDLWPFAFGYNGLTRHTYRNYAARCAVRTLLCCEGVPRPNQSQRYVETQQISLCFGVCCAYIYVLPPARFANLAQCIGCALGYAVHIYIYASSDTNVWGML